MLITRKGKGLTKEMFENYRYLPFFLFSVCFEEC